ncbi:MAG TPA: T9SS type A sorting domain-containing protein [Puia sp.]|nr:T9SS type A sorting domain-containing protein [Puia sp.]
MKNRLILHLGLIFGISMGSARAQTFGNVAIGGGGFVSGIITSKIEQNLIYIRTDVGGAYRWDNTNGKWIPLLDWVSTSQTGYQGVESLATDPVNSNNLYMLVGTSYFNSGQTAILRSTDKGNSFTVTDVSSLFKENGNGMGRQSGEKLQVDPNNNSILYCGSRANGLFKSTNSGSNWSRLSSLNVTTTPNGNGLSFVLLDKSAVSGGATQRIFAGVSQTGTNFYVSNNGGTSFSAISGGPTTLMPQRAVLASDGNLYITFANGAGPFGVTTPAEPMDSGQLWKYNVAAGSWTNVTPSGFINALGGISVDPNNASRLMLSSVNTYWSQGSAWGDQFFLSTNGGSGWTNVVARGFTLDGQGVPWINSSQSIHWAGCIEFDPFNTGKVWVTSGNGIFRNDDISTGTWKAIVAGLEETVPQDMVSIPGGPIFSAIGDYDGFKQTSPSAYGTQYAPTMGSNSGIAYAATNTQDLVRVGTTMYYTINQGTTWTQCAAMPPANGSTASNFGYVALSSSGGRIMYAPANGNNTSMYYSTDNGSSWTQASGISFNSIPTFDFGTKNRFFAYNPADGYLYYASNGTSFSKGAYTGSLWGSAHIRTVPGFTGHVWVPLYGGGLVYSTNGASSSTAFIKLSTVSACSAVGFGKTATGATYPTIYIWGTVNGVEGVYRSTDKGASWTRINDSAHQWGGIGNGQFVTGDWNTYGLVYISTVGRGIATIGSGSVASASAEGTAVEAIPASLATSDSALRVFPNPVRDNLTVQLSEDFINSKITLFTVAGQEVYTSLATNFSVTIPMNKLSPGIYLLTISKGTRKSVTRIVKQ